MKRIIVHIGFPKTGTTTIQSFCRTHRETLRDRGVDYPSLALSGNKTVAQSSHTALMTALMLKPPPRLADHKADAITSVDQAIQSFRAGDARTLFLSHETISQRQDLDFARLRSWTEGLELTVLAFIRTFDEWLESLYAQSARDDRSVVKPFKEMRLSKLPAVAFLPQLRAIKAGLPDASIRVLSYDAYRSGGLMTEVLHQIGVEAPRLLSAAAEDHRRNSARSTVEVMFGAYAALALNEPDITKAVIQAFGKARAAGRTVPYGERKYRFVPPDLKRRARENFRADLPSLNREFGIELPDPGPVTPAESDYRTTLSREEYDTLFTIVAPYLSAGQAEQVRTAYDTAHPRFAA